MKLLLLLLIFIYTPFSVAQQRPKINSINIKHLDESEIYDIDSVVVVKQRFIKAKGFVKDDHGKALPDVIITHGGGKNKRKTVSDKDGYFVLDSVKSGYPLIRFMKQGYITLAYKFNNYDVEQVILAFDPNSTLARYDLGYFKDSKLTSATAVRVISGDALRRYAVGGQVMSVVSTLLGARNIRVLILNNMMIVPNKGESIESIFNTFNLNHIALVAYLPPYSANAALYGITSNNTGILIVKLKQ